MKRIAFALGFLLSVSAAAQQGPQIDPAAAQYRQGLIEANDKLAAANKQVQALDAKVKELTKALEDEEARTKPATDKPADK